MLTVLDAKSKDALCSETPSRPNGGDLDTRVEGMV
jgi:hypothetical protein